MHFARTKYTRSLITPDAARRGIPYECPECNAETYLRLGERNAAYFAHAPGKASLECENYHPPTGFSPHSLTAHGWQSNTNYRYAPFQPALVLIKPDIDVLELAIKLPAIESAQPWPGKIIFNNALGQSSLDQQSFKTARFLHPLDAATEYYEFQRLGEVDESIWEILAAKLKGLPKLEKAYFVRNEIGGRMLQDEEVLFRNEQYWALMHEDCENKPLSDPVLKYIREIDRLGEYRVFEIDMPETRLLDKYENELSEWLARPFGERQPAIRFDKYFPVRVLEDGTFVFPDDTQTISLYAPKPDLTFTLKHQLSEEPECYDSFNEGTSFHISFDKMLKGELCVHVDGIPRMWILFEETDWFEPQGIILSSGNLTANLASPSEFFETLKYSHADAFKISVPHPSVRKLLRINSHELGYEVDDSQEFKINTENFSIDAKNFGRYFPVTTSVTEIIQNLDADIINKIKWLKAVSTLDTSKSLIYFPCQSPSWWALMSSEIQALRRLKWFPQHLPHLVQIKNELSKIYEN